MDLGASTVKRCKDHKTKSFHIDIRVRAGVSIEAQLF